MENGILEVLHWVSRICKKLLWHGFQIKSLFSQILVPQRQYYGSPISHRFAFAGIENPLVMKSECFSSIPFLFENKLFTLSFAPSFLRLFRSSCSARTFAVKDAVFAFLMLLSGFSLFVCVGSRGSSAAVASSTVAVFFLFLPAPGAFLRECVRPWDFRSWMRCSRRSLSVWEMGRMGMIFSVVKDWLHCFLSAYSYDR